MKKLLFVANTDKFFLSHRMVIAEEARRRGYDVSICCIDTGLADRIRETGFPYIPLPATVAGIHPLQELKTLWFLVGLYRRLRPNIIHHIAVKPVVYGSIAARLTRMPTVVNALSGLGYTFIETENASFGRKTARFAVERLIRFALGHKNSRLILQNQDDIRMFTSRGWIPEERISWIRGSGVDTKVFSSRPEPPGNPITIMLPSRMLWDKGIGEFVSACRLLKKSFGESIRCVLVGGTGFENPAVIPEESVTSWVDEGVVEWWGERDDMPDVLAQAHIVVLPSYREGLPRVLIEACSLGRAIVTTDVPGCREVVQHGSNGLLVPAKSVKELGDAIGTLVRDSETRARMGENGRLRAESEFLLSDVLEKHFLLYQQVTL